MPTISPRKVPNVSGAVRGVATCGLVILAVSAGITCSAIAGDLLRGGYTASQSTSSSPNALIPASVTQARQHARDVLARTTQAINAVNAMQSAARKLAAGGANNLGINPNVPGQSLPNVPDGLNAGPSTGGLVPDSGLLSSGVANPVTTWTGATTPTQSTTSGGQTVVNIVQTAQDAVLNWQTFNIGKRTTLDINQNKGGADADTWIAFNIIRDSSGVPSQILGAINAPGQVYVINQNGIVFGGASQVNVHTLVASSLPIDTFLIQNGLLDNPDDQFLFSAIAQPAGINGSPAFTPPVSYAPGGGDGDVIVQPGAEIDAPANANSVGGRVALIGPNVTNNGTISTPDGQTILAAGLQIGFAASTAPTLRGLDAYVGAVSDPSYAGPAAGTAINGGLIVSPGGDAMITGRTVEQLGAISSVTAVALNGEVDLLADYGAVSNATNANAGGAVAPFLYSSTGIVEMGPGSAIGILPDSSTVNTVVGTVLALPSIVNIQGQAIHFGQNSTLLAPNANVTANAGFWFVNGQSENFQYFSTATSSPQVYLDPGAEIDVAGSTGVSESVTQNIIPVQLLGAQLADDPAQRDLLHGQTIYIDIRESGIYDGQAWIGTPLADTTGYVGLIQSDASELTIDGGTVTIKAGGSVVMSEGSTVDVSGGYIDYSGGMVQTTKILSDGHIYDISQADPDMDIQGIYSGQFTVDHPSYGISETFTDPLIGGATYEEGYIYGGNGGSVSITAPSMALDGLLLGLTESGARQRQLQAAPSAFSLAFSAQNPSVANPGVPQFSTYYPTPPDIFIESGVTQAPAPAFTLDSSGGAAPLPADRLAKVYLSPDLTDGEGFGIFSIDDTDGNITVPAGVSWQAQATTYTNAGGAPAHGSITLLSANTTVDGSIIVPGGDISFSVYDISPYQALVDADPADTVQPVYSATRGNFILGSGASLDTSGLLVDDRPDAVDPETEPLTCSGGAVSIAASNIDLGSGSLINVSGGIDVSPTGTLSYGAGGAVTMKSGRDLTVSSALGGGLRMEGKIEGYSGSTGGSLSLTALAVRIGGVSAGLDSLVLDTDFFDQGGFASFSINGIAAPTATPDVYSPGLAIAPGADVNAVAENYILEAPLVEGESLSLVPELLSQQSRTPVSLNFTAAGTTNVFKALVARGDLVVGAGAVIESDPGGVSGASITFRGDTVAILGSVLAPAGAISITGAQASNSTLFPGAANSSVAPLATVDIGPAAVLSTAGVTVMTANAYGYTTGNVLGGGPVSVSGNIVAEAGAVINVSGASDMLDRLATYSSLDPNSNGALTGALLAPTLVESNAGTITLTGAQGLFCDATLLGKAGGRAAIGGELLLSSGVFLGPGAQVAPSTPTLQITQDGPTIPAGFYPKGKTAIGYAVLGRDGTPLPGIGYLAADTFEKSGMDFLELEGSVFFKGPVDLSAAGTLIVATGGYLYADSTVHLTAPYVALGTPFAAPLSPMGTTNESNSGIYNQGRPYDFNPTGGSGILEVSASLIDIGNLSLQGIGNADFVAQNGDIRGDGTLDAAGNIFMRADQIYPPTEVTFNIISYGGSVTFASSGSEQIPLSAGGILNVYASTINQDGVLVAPLGEINLGWDGAGASPVDPLTGAGLGSGNTGATIPIAQSITLGRGSVTSVSGVDFRTGNALLIPYGVNENGASWIDPGGTDITAGGVPQKSISISGQTVTDMQGATIDISGGGDLFAYRFVSGVQGTQDILGTDTSFAILPGYTSPFAPYAPYNTESNSTAFPNYYTSSGGQSDAGYYNPSLQGAKIGQEVYLAGNGGLSSGFYTLLPARYALLPGGYLVTPVAGGTPLTAAVTEPDGSALEPGYTVYGMNTAQTGQPLYGAYNVASQAVVLNSAEYDEFSGDSFLATGAVKNDQPVPGLPKDGGHLIINAVDALTVAGSLLASTPASGNGALVDISTSNPDGILIAGPGVSGGSGQLVLDAATLTSFGSGSLLIGGVRTVGADGDSVDVTTTRIDVDNSGAPLAGADIILAATGDIDLSPGAEIESVGHGVPAPDITLAGNGALLRVSSDPDATVTRTGVTTGNTAVLTIGNGSKISGGGITLDSSQSTNFGAGISLTGQSLALNSGHIIIDLSGAAPSDGLALTAQALDGLTAGARSFSLLSYQSLDIYGSGQIGGTSSTGQPTLQSLALQAGAINGFGGGDVAINAQKILLGNAADSTVIAGTVADNGALAFDARIISLGANQVNIGQYSAVTLNATGGIIQAASGGLAATGNLTANTPLITAATGVTGNIAAGGALSIQAPAQAGAGPKGGEGAHLTMTAASIDDDSQITAQAGNVSMVAVTGNLTLDSQASINVSGAAQNFFDVTKYTGGGQVSLTADSGDVNIAAGADNRLAVDVSAPSGGGNGGTFTVSAANGAFNLAGTIAGNAGAGGEGGNFNLDVGALSNLQTLDAALNTAGFNHSRTFRVRTGDVEVAGLADAANFLLSVDQGGIDVAGTIDASGATGGTVTLEASGDVSVDAAAKITAVGQDYNSAGQGGAVSLETTGGAISIDGEIDLGVTDAPSGSGALQDETGTLYLRAPQLDAGDAIASTPNSGVGVNIAPIAGTVSGASSIVVEGFYTQTVNAPTADIDSFEAAALTNATSFMTNASAISSRVAGSSGLSIQVRPGEEIDNTGGNLVLENDWDLSLDRYGPTLAITLDTGPTIQLGTEPGVLTLRASGSIIFNGALTDGFGDDSGNEAVDSNGVTAQWLNPLLPQFNNGRSQLSWSYNIAAGADFAAANPLQVIPVSQAIANDTGSVTIGIPTPGGNLSLDQTVETAIEGNYQVIRTGAGSINVAAAMDVQLFNQFATIYTAGTQVNPEFGMTQGFDVPITSVNPATGIAYPAQYSYEGGNVNVTAGRDIVHLTEDINGVVQDDSSLEMPTDWLYRRGAVGPDGTFATTLLYDTASTTWWVDFSNFFEDIGALGGGNVSLIAGADVMNVDAVVPTNARMPGIDYSTGNTIAPDAANLVELGGGNLLVQAGNDINGGVYYVERGTGVLTAGNQILTNASRSPNYASVVGGAGPAPEDEWLPTTLFLGDGTFDVSALSNILMGPVVNAFLLPAGQGNSIYDKSYFSTYAASSSVDVTSFGGSIDLREFTTDIATSFGIPVPILEAWYDNQTTTFNVAGATGAAYYQPWLQTVETDPTAFSTVYDLLPPTLELTAFGGNIDLFGNLDLYPSPTGAINLLASGAINGLQPVGINNSLVLWVASEIDVSDSPPNALYGITDPLSITNPSPFYLYSTSSSLYAQLTAFFTDSGSVTGNFGVVQTKDELHGSQTVNGVLEPLHAGDTTPDLLYAAGGDIADLSLFSPNQTRVVASGNITDVGLYIQNTAASDVSIVSAGENIIAYDPESPSRFEAHSAGNELIGLSRNPETGDIQIAGPGTLEVLAGDNLTLGAGPNNSDGTAVGISSIGNNANPYLPFGGASIVAAAGLGTAADGLSGANTINFTTFIDQVLGGAEGSVYFSDLAQTDPALPALGVSNLAELKKLLKQTQLEDIVALDLFYLVLRDAGRDHNLVGNPGYGNYAAGTAAIKTLLGSDPAASGDIDLTSKEIATQNGGDIDLLDPAGQITVGVELAGAQPVEQGILTDDGGNISIYAGGSVNLGTSRIFTLRGGNIIIWSNEGNIDAGASSKTVQAAPPTRVIVDPQSANVETDLAGLATGGGIGVLASVVGVPVGSVDLIAPTGVINAGDAGIRATGNLNLAAVQVLNASNIQAGGATSGVPTVTVAAPNLAGLAAASSAAGAGAAAATQQTASQNQDQSDQQTAASVISVEVIGYGGGDAGDTGG